MAWPPVLVLVPRLPARLQSGNFTAMNRIKAKHRIALTGYPLQVKHASQHPHPPLVTLTKQAARITHIPLITAAQFITTLFTTR